MDPDSYKSLGTFAGTNYGWQFTVNVPIVVTHLGAFDAYADGFETNHIISLWRLSDQSLLTSGTISAGTVDPLLDDFRYIDIPDIALSVAVDYVVGYYSGEDNGDKMISLAEDLQVNPAVNLVVGRWDVSGVFQMPANIYEWDPLHDPYYPDFFGPNFQFVPEPATISLIALGGLVLLRRRRR